MIKHLAILFAAISLLASCDKAPQKTEAKVYDVISFLESADTLVGKEVTIRGTVLHVCAHSGKKCFIQAENSEESILITAGGEFEVFDKAIVGKTIEAVGLVKETRTEEAKIIEKEAALKEKQEKIDTTNVQQTEHCNTEQNNIESMRNWMKNHNKDYFASYSIEGIRYSVIDDTVKQ